MKVFISQPMNGKTDKEIKETRESIIRKLKEIHPNIEVIDSFFEGAPHDANPLWYLGKSIQLLSQADIAYFAEGWENARGCKLEHACAVAYGIQSIVE